MCAPSAFLAARTNRGDRATKPRRRRIDRAQGKWNETDEMVKKKVWWMTKQIDYIIAFDCVCVGCARACVWCCVVVCLWHQPLPVGGSDWMCATTMMVPNAEVDRFDEGRGKNHFPSSHTKTSEWQTNRAAVPREIGNERVGEINRLPVSINPNNSQSNLFIYYYYLDFGHRPEPHIAMLCDGEHDNYRHIDTRSKRSQHTYIQTTGDRKKKQCDPTNSIFQLGCVDFYLFSFLFFLLCSSSLWLTSSLLSLCDVMSAFIIGIPSRNHVIFAAKMALTRCGRKECEPSIRDPSGTIEMSAWKMSEIIY